MKVLCFSSFTFAYLDRARVLFQTVRRHHPDWELVALITDRPPDSVTLDLSVEDFDRVVHVEDLDLPGGSAWLFGHEGQGVADDLLKLSHQTVVVPHLGQIFECIQEGACK